MTAPALNRPVDVLFDVRECAALLGAAKQEPAALRLLDAHDAFADLIEATRGLIEFVEPILTDHGFGYVGRIEKARKALAAIGMQS
jgi:hypothetical protein